MIRTMLLTADGHYLTGGEELVQQWRDSHDGQLWLDIESEPTAEIKALLQSMACDPLAIKDGFRARHPPKVEHFDANTFILFRGISQLDDTLELVPQQIGLWVGEGYLITARRGHSVSITQYWGRESELGLLRRPGILAVRILHYACGRYLEKLLSFEDQLAELEDGLRTESSEKDMKELAGYRARLQRLKRIFSYHKAMSEQIWQDSGPFLAPGEDDTRHERRDLYDRCERLHSLCQMYYEICGDLIEGHISLSSHALNQTMKVLTIISALFVPLTFMAGIYGMNFEHMPELGWRYSYFVLLGVMAVLATVMLVIFRRVRWL